ncbi:methyl-accepting chemotaxis (MCP) signaling domain protein [Methyloversatilis sp. RAC08]|uniref:methyl-accepting chemotaxis protein n=1 Tax=Methyloversatilis sp. RAC08 TaxID=1842540 RepID=UPI00083D1DD6|nr:methyl-accepting chemotaxis protein [Methyloversatilis sp. RAC08]AOF80995.1 methyl-accepting chemotaxis (MCP) signaling domain protein [Methyloversatilis sp. RAC08]
MALNIPGLKSAAQAGSDPAPSNQLDAAGFLRGRLPLIGHLPLGQQVRSLAVIFLLFIALAAVLVWQDWRGTRQNAAHIHAAGQLRTLMQGVTQSAPQALAGQAGALGQLSSARAAVTALLDTLNRGGEVDGVSLPPARGAAKDALQQIDAAWSGQDRNTALLLGQQKTLIALGEAGRALDAAATPMMTALGRIAAQRGARDGGLSLSLAGSVGQVRAAIHALTSITPTSADTLDALQRALPVLLDTAAQLEQSAEGEPREAFAQAHNDLVPRLTALVTALDKPADLLAARAAGLWLIGSAAALAGPTDALATVYSAQREDRALRALGAALCVLLALASVFLMVRAYNEDQHRQRVLVEGSREEAKREKDTTQQAILRLMNEMGDLADGDLTVRATVSEDITGAIADSVNYTIEELSVLVKRINDAAGRVAEASESAQRISTQLLTAAERQSREVTESGQSVLAMAKSMNAVSEEATRSAQVARQSLAAAQNGSNAVSNSIRGMNDIRDQIQETSKRIKRLGESSQEISEIVELISDITEQTNVLALNAAIQAAGAGEAGRGFTVVAEEVQRLAERSGEATKQIAAIVRTIQTDTQDAVAAMENSTRGVVEGARLSDAAGQALDEISTVSTELTELIEAISSSAQVQAEQATRVAHGMQGILRITEQTTVGTKQTALSIGQLADLAAELKGSVAGFKV